MQKFFANTPRKMVELAMKQLIGNDRVFMQRRTVDEFISGHRGEMTKSTEVPRNSERYPCAGEKHSGNSVAMK